MVATPSRHQNREDARNEDSLHEGVAALMTVNGSGRLAEED
jgi:hypothetical protein